METKTVVNVQFDELERAAMERAALAVFVGYPDPQTDAKRKNLNTDAEAHSMFRRITTKNEWVETEYLHRVGDMLEGLRVVLDREVRAEHWDAMVTQVEQENAKMVAERGVLPLIADPARMAEVLIEARKQMLADVIAAQTVVADALTHELTPA